MAPGQGWSEEIELGKKVGLQSHGSAPRKQGVRPGANHHDNILITSWPLTHIKLLKEAPGILDGRNTGTERGCPERSQC